MTDSAKSSVELEFNSNKGPLLMVAMALFGNTSYITTRTAHPEAYELTQEQAQAGLDTEVGTSPTQGCYDLYRLIALRRSQSGTSVQPNTCTQLAAPDDIAHQISLWLQILWLGPMGVRVSNTTYQISKPRPRPCISPTRFGSNKAY
jgi:hypothetical protein